MKHRFWPFFTLLFVIGLFALPDPPAPTVSSVDSIEHTVFSPDFQAVAFNQDIQNDAYPGFNMQADPVTTQRVTTDYFAHPSPPQPDHPVIAMGQVTDSIPEPGAGQSNSLWLFLKANYVSLIWGILALLEVITRLTPSEKDNTVLAKITGLMDKVLPNRRAGGGTLS